MALASDSGASPQAASRACHGAPATAETAAQERQARGVALQLIAIAALAWIALLLWHASPAGVWLDHGSWIALGLYETLCLWGGDAGAVGVFAGVFAWLLMLAAMMLPTTAPMMTAVAAAAPDARARRAGLAAAATGYALVWLGFGVVAHLVDAWIQALAADSLWIRAHGWALGAATLAGAGLYQFSALKGACRAACAAPLLAVSADRVAAALPTQAFRAGLSHGAACLGCCWALMLLMFVVGMGNLAWMLVLALVMAAEKTLPRGAELSAPIGLALLAAAAAVTGAHL